MIVNIGVLDASKLVKNTLPGLGELKSNFEAPECYTSFTLESLKRVRSYYFLSLSPVAFL